MRLTAPWVLFAFCCLVAAPAVAQPQGDATENAPAGEPPPDSEEQPSLAVNGTDTDAETGESDPGAEENEIEPWDGEETDVNDEPCPFDPSGEGLLRRTEGSMTGASMSNGWESVELVLGDKSFIELSQEDPIRPGGGNHVEHPLQINCEPGFASIEVPGAGAIELALVEGQFRFAPTWLAGLERFLNAVEPKGWRQLYDLLEELQEIDPIPFQRARLKWAEVSIRTGDWVEAEKLLRLSLAPAGLAAREKELAARLARLQSRKPLRVSSARPVAPLAPWPVMPPKPQPTLFWRGAELCVAQQGAAPASMRCFNPGKRHWSDREQLIDPVAPNAVGWNQDYCGRPCLYQTDWTFSADAAQPRDVGYLDPDDLLAYLPDGRLLGFELGRDARAFKLLSGTSAESEMASGPELARLLAQTPGTRLAAAGRYLLSRQYVVDTSQPNRYWLLLGGAIGSDEWGDWRCHHLFDPLVSPDSRWAACVAELVKPSAQAGTMAPPPLSLWVFRLAER